MTSESLKATIQSDLHTAIRERDQVRSGTLRMVLSAITTEEVAGESARELSDDEVLKVVAKEAKKRKEASVAYVGAQRPELAAKEDAELAVIEGYLPAQLDDAQLEQIVAGAIAETGASGMAQMGQVMKVAGAKVAGRADGGRVAAIVKRTLAG
ncbi:GatB/YqeY domain-containing protein [Janibacter sp. G56]|uniref:GatB/YqeY domain-containing protein n=1 Tax=Janibacter sp. G56 TaxID=3418717 RepID=UPI003D021A86